MGFPNPQSPLFYPSNNPLSLAPLEVEQLQRRCPLQRAPPGGQAGHCAVRHSVTSRGGGGGVVLPSPWTSWHPAQSPECWVRSSPPVVTKQPTSSRSLPDTAVTSVSMEPASWLRLKV